MVSILFVCHGNICRSTMAESVFTHLVKQRGIQDLFEIDSAATSTEEIGNGVHRGTQRVLRDNNVPCIPHRARQITRVDLDKFDLVVCMDGNNVRNMNRMFGARDAAVLDEKVVRLMTYAGENRDVADPWYTGDFETTYRDVLAGCESLLDWLKDRSYQV